MWYIFHSPINYFADWYLQRKSHAESWPQKGTVWQRYGNESWLQGKEIKG